ncbi:MAG: hypothetical protein KIT37_04065 [Steroidobacteraceae bacterium]|nr:hypothetical protein [Steroidobacteraceae bacterium]
MRSVLVAVLALAAGFLLARGWWREAPAADPIQVIVTQVKTHAIIEHERQIAIWYRSCPEVIGVNPEIFVAWPGKLSYELELADVAITRSGDRLIVKTGAIRADEPAIPTDFLDYLTTAPWFNFANEQELVNREIARASPIARYLSAYYQRRDPSLVDDFRRELAELVMRLAGALGLGIESVEVEIPVAEVKFPKLPALELCASTTASVNGVPFAKVEDGYTIPFAFDAAAAAGRRAPGGVIAGVGVKSGEAPRKRAPD